MRRGHARGDRTGADRRVSCWRTRDLGISLRRVAGEEGLDRPLRHPRVQKNGLALAGHYHGVVPTRVQVLGETELSYLDSLSGEARSVAARGLLRAGPVVRRRHRRATSPRARSSPRPRRPARRSS